MKSIKKIVAPLLGLAVLATLNACQTSVDGKQSSADSLETEKNAENPVESSKTDEKAISAVNLMTEISPSAPADADLTEENIAAVMDFSFRLFQESASPENVMISPVSVLYAFAMTANGADRNTLAQMEETFGLSSAELNETLRAYRNRLPSAEGEKLNIANSIWFRDVGINVERDFLQTNADYYGADIYESPFDETTREEINAWVVEKTDGMIPSLLDEPIPDSALMYLLNAVAFDAAWKKPYSEYSINDSALFTREDGSTQTVSLMYSTETRYLEDENTVGFIKHYKDQNYAFVALLPREGVSLADYVASLTGEKFRNLLQNVKRAEVSTAIPKFESSYSVEMSEILKKMGISDAFDGSAADLSKLGSSPVGNLFINRVLHKTYISVDEKGTKAAAVTGVEVAAESCPVDEFFVFCDRPFVYAVVDCEYNLPVFLGTVTEVNG